jgi:methionine synthase II (cobalamin-independent)
MNYDPRAATGIPTEPVGSIPRPLKLQQAYLDYDAKKISKAQLEEEQNAAVADTIKRFEATGSPIITDGEQRVSSFATYPIADTLAGSGLAPHLAPGGQYFAIFADGHNRQLPKITGGPFRYNFYAGELVKKAVKMTNKPLHQAVIAPSMMYLLYPLDGDLPGYSRKQFEDDIVNECENDIRSCFDAGAAHVVMDFTEGRLAPRNDPRNPWTTRNLLSHFIELDNRVFDRFSAEEREKIGVHVCPGGDVDSVHSADVPYEELLKHCSSSTLAISSYKWPASATENPPTSSSAHTCGMTPKACSKWGISAVSLRKARELNRCRKCAINWLRRLGISTNSASARPMIAVSLHSVLTRSPIMAAPTTRVTSLFRR